MAVRAARKPVLVACAVVLCAMSGLAGPTAAAAGSPAVAAPGQCKPVWFIGARGSGEPQSISTDGMGPEVFDMYNAVHSYLTTEGVATAHVAVDYAAVSVDVLKPNATVLQFIHDGDDAAAFTEWIQTSVDKYDASMDDGIRQTEDDVEAAVSACPDVRIVLGGYSQGAVAVHDAENYLAKNQPADFAHIAGTLLLGDPDRVPDTKAKAFGTEPANGEGLRVYACLVKRFHVCLVKPHDVPAPATTAEIANAHDIVANFTWQDVTSSTARKQATSVHTSYAAKDARLLASAAKWVAAKIPVQAPHAIEVPGTAALNTGGDAQVSSVSCPSAGNCAVGGYYAGSSNDAEAFVADEVNGTWQDAVEMPGTATLNAGGNARVLSVSCASAGNCTAGGFYNTGSYAAEAFVADQVSGTWQNAIKVPGTATLNAGGNAEVTSVSCASVGACTVGGYYTDSSGVYTQAFVADEVNGTWQHAVEVPGTAVLNVGGDAEVTSVSCASAGNCTGGGYYTDGSGVDTYAFVADEVNGTWQDAIEVPGTATLNTGDYARVTSVSCASAGNCAAGGYYDDSSNAGQAFVADEVSGTWQNAAEVPGTATLNTGGYAEVTSVSCASAGNCAASGGYGDSSGNQVFVADEVNGAWQNAAEIPGTAALNIGSNAFATGVSCTSAGNCTAAGYYATGTALPYAAAEVNGTWQDAVEVPGTAALNGGNLAEGLAVSCASAGDCTLGGFYRDESSTIDSQAFVAEVHG